MSFRQIKPLEFVDARNVATSELSSICLDYFMPVLLKDGSTVELDQFGDWADKISYEFWSGIDDVMDWNNDDEEIIDIEPERNSPE